MNETAKITINLQFHCISIDIENNKNCISIDIDLSIKDEFERFKSL